MFLKPTEILRNKRHFPAEITAEYTATLPGLMCKSLPRAAALGGREGMTETGAPAPSSTPSTDLFLRSMSLPRELGSGPRSPQQDTSVPLSPCRGHTALHGDTSPCHQVLTPTHPTNQTCSTEPSKHAEPVSASGPSPRLGRQKRTLCSSKILLHVLHLILGTRINAGCSSSYRILYLDVRKKNKINGRSSWGGNHPVTVLECSPCITPMIIPEQLFAPVI